MKRMFTSLLGLSLLILPFFLGCESQHYAQAPPPQVQAPQPQVSQQEMLKGVIQDYLNQSSSGNQILGANFLPLTSNVYIAQAQLQGGSMTFKKDFTVECVGDPNNPQWQVQPANEATLREVMTRYNINNEVEAIYHHPSYQTASYLDAIL